MLFVFQQTGKLGKYIGFELIGINEENEKVLIGFDSLTTIVIAIEV